jgi:hypothetical protein
MEPEEASRLDNEPLLWSSSLLFAIFGAEGGISAHHIV